MAGRTMIHANGNMVCAIDVETTGLRPFHNDMIQVCVLPLDSELKPAAGIMPFYTEMQPKRPENVDLKAMGLTKLELCKIMQNALDADRVADLFEEWFSKLPLPHGKKLIPLAHNWIYDHAFMTDWLGYEHMNHYFFGHHRSPIAGGLLDLHIDLMTAALFENDKADFNVEQTPYPKLGLKYLCGLLGVELVNAHDALADCVATAECYRRLMQRRV